MELNPGQQHAVEEIEAWIDDNNSPQLSLTGPAGTGKSSIMRMVKNILPAGTMWTAMTGKAALRLRETAGVNATTLHSALYSRPRIGHGGALEFDKLKKPEGGFLCIDEASMMSPKIYEDLQNWTADGVKILYVGDGFQLPPVLSQAEEQIYGKDFSVFSLVKGPKLTQVMRTGDDVIRAATQLREEDQLPRKSTGKYRFIRTSSPGNRAINDYLEDRSDHVLITWRNDLRMEANELIRKKLGYEGPIPVQGEPVLIKKNGQDVLNGEIIETNYFREGPKLAEVICHWFHDKYGTAILVNTMGKTRPMDGMMQFVKNWKSYNMARNSLKHPEPIPVTYGYVLTCHSGQGSEFRRVSVFLTESDLHNPHFRAMTKLPDGSEMSFATRWAYTSCTRSKDILTIYLGG